MKPYYEHAGITIYHGDMLALLPELPAADVILTDPPYGVGFDYGVKYEDTDRNYAAWMGRAFEAMRRSAKVVLLTTGMRNLWLYPPADWILCWAKPGATRRSDLGGFNEWEPVYVYGKVRIFNDFKYLPDCANHSADFAREHPCPKPLALYRWLIEQASVPGQLIIDPFCGSGTTLKAAKELKCHAIGIEIEEKYCEIAAKRLSQEVLEFTP